MYSFAPWVLALVRLYLPLCVCLCLCLSVCLSVVHLKRAISALQTSVLDTQTQTYRQRQTHRHTQPLPPQPMVSRVDMVMAALACLCLSLSVCDFLSLVCQELCLMVCVSESRCLLQCCALAGMCGDFVHFCTVRHLHCHCLLVLLVPKRCRSALCFAACLCCASQCIIIVCTISTCIIIVCTILTCIIIVCTILTFIIVCTILTCIIIVCKVLTCIIIVCTHVCAPITNTRDRTYDFIA